ncbi:MAG: AI-2E family transporter [Alphaproteobacteria bacterium]|nr:AI-2E family transporter [Alphaproteobacteria bacterium]
MSSEVEQAPGTTNEDGKPVMVLTDSDRRSISINGIFVLLILYAIYFAASVLIPVTLALLLSMLFHPVVRIFEKVGLPSPVGAAITVSVTIIILLSTVYGLSGSAREWVERVPQNFFRIEEMLDAVKKPIEKLKDAADKVESATEMKGAGRPLEVRVQRPGVTEQFLTGTPQVVASIGVVVMLLYFLLASGDAFVRKSVESIPRFKDKKRMVEIIRSIQEDVSYYLIMLTALNIMTGAVVGLTCWGLGFPNPILWGVIVTVLSYAPFVGSAVITAILSFVGLLTYSNLTWALMPAGVYLIVMFLVTNAAIPYMLGSRLALSPVAIFISIIFWGWMWGVVGALVAVPLLATLKIVCDRVDSLRPVSEFLSP